MTRLLTALLFVCVFFSSLARAEEEVFKDPFTTDAKVKERRALRGDWIIADGVASCTQDDDLYKKYKDHGPIIFYDHATGDCTVRFRFKPEGCKTFVFTMNAESGHIFRFVTSERGTSIRAFPPEGDKKSIEAGRGKDWVLKEGEWTAVEVVVKGEKVTVKMGEHEPIISEHSTFSKGRSNLSVGFAFGTCSVMGFEVAE